MSNTTGRNKSAVNNTTRHKIKIECHECKRLKEIIECKDILLVAYRLSTTRGIGRALDRLRILEAKK